MRLAIGIPCYHSKDLLHISVGSLATQVNAADLDVILSFDGDDTAQETIEYVQNTYEKYFHNVFYLINEQNQGTGGNRNNILHFVYGDYAPEITHLAFMDHDDAILSVNTLKLCCEDIEANVDADLFLSDIHEELYDGDIKVRYWNNNVWVHGKIFLVETLKKYNILFPLHESEDCAFCAITTHFCKNKVRLTYPTYYWRFNRDSQSRDIDTDYFKRCGAGFTLAKLSAMQKITESDCFREAQKFGFFGIAAVYYNSFCNYGAENEDKDREIQAIHDYLHFMKYKEYCKDPELWRLQMESFLYTPANELLIGCWPTMGLEEWVEYYWNWGEENGES